MKITPAANRAELWKQFMLATLHGNADFSAEDAAATADDAVHEYEARCSMVGDRFEFRLRDEK